MLALYSIADLAWCFYSPEYDQASGILGRALQFSVTPVVRKGSVSEWFCASERMPHIASIDAIGLGGVIGEYELKKTSRRALEASFERFARVSCEKINYSLGKGPEKAE